MTRDEVLTIIGNLAGAVSCANLDAVEVLVGELADAYTVDIKAIRAGIQEMNDVPAYAAELAADPLMHVRVLGTLYRNTSDIIATFYDIERSMDMAGYLHDLSAAIMVAKEAYAIVRDRPSEPASTAGASE